MALPPSIEEASSTRVLLLSKPFKMRVALAARSAFCISKTTTDGCGRHARCTGLPLILSYSGKIASVGLKMFARYCSDGLLVATNFGKSSSDGWRLLADVFEPALDDRNGAPLLGDLLREVENRLRSELDDEGAREDGGGGGAANLPDSSCECGSRRAVRLPSAVTVLTVLKVLAALAALAVLTVLAVLLVLFVLLLLVALATLAVLFKVMKHDERECRLFADVTDAVFGDFWTPLLLSDFL